MGRYFRAGRIFGFAARSNFEQEIDFTAWSRSSRRSGRALGHNFFAP
jgi:hypothetical protein